MRKTTRETSKRNPVGVGTALAALALCAACAVPGCQPETAAPPDGDEDRTEQTADGSLPVNASGETYGSITDAAKTGQELDLVLVMATNGKEGYVRQADLSKAERAADGARTASDLMAEREQLALSTFIKEWNAMAPRESAIGEHEAKVLLETYTYFYGTKAESTEKAAALSAVTSMSEERRAEMTETAYQKAQEATMAYIPVYESDGKTVVGQFPVAQI